MPGGRGIIRSHLYQGSRPEQLICHPQPRVHSRTREQRLAMSCPFLSGSHLLPTHEQLLPLHFQITCPSSPPGSFSRYQKRQSFPPRWPGLPTQDKKPSMTHKGSSRPKQPGLVGTLLPKPLPGEQRDSEPWAPRETAQLLAVSWHQAESRPCGPVCGVTCGLIDSTRAPHMPQGAGFSHGSKSGCHHSKSEGNGRGHVDDLR